jgi:GLPGLI family protein
MSKKHILVLAFWIPIAGIAQFTIGNNKIKLKDPKNAIASILYDFFYITDTTKSDVIQKEVVRLDFNEAFSNFFSQTFQISDSLTSIALQQQIKEQQGQANLNFSVPQREGSSEVFLSDIQKVKVYELKRLINRIYLISDPTPTIQWDIQDSIKIIGGYNCQKAVGISKGRQYIAWFTTDLPYSFGPRRLSGLPGLIIEAYDATHRIVYTFKQYIPNGNGAQIGLPVDAIVANPKEYNEMQDAFRANPQAFSSGSAPGATPNAPANNSSIQSIKSITIVAGSGTNRKAKKVNNFPIDLIAE